MNAWWLAADTVPAPTPVAHPTKSIASIKKGKPKSHLILGFP